MRKEGSQNGHEKNQLFQSELLNAELHGRGTDHSIGITANDQVRTDLQIPQNLDNKVTSKFKQNIGCFFFNQNISSSFHVLKMTPNSIWVYLSFRQKYFLTSFRGNVLCTFRTN